MVERERQRRRKLNHLLSATRLQTFMADGLVIHIDTGGERFTEVLTDETIRIGGCADCQIRLTHNAEGAASSGAMMLELARTNGHYRVVDFDAGIDLTFNGRPIVPGAVINDADTVRVESLNLGLQFFPLGEQSATIVAASSPGKRAAHAHVAPFIERASIESAVTARRDDAKVFLREFTRELVREISPVTKIVTLLIAVALVGGTLYFGYAAYQEIRRTRRQNEALNERLAQMQEQVNRTNSEISGLTESNNDIIESMSFAPQMRSEFGSGVCFIAGTYIFVERGTGRPLREPETTPTEDGGEEGGAPPTGEQPLLTPEGRGAIVERRFSGTGFYVGNGYVLTNHHLAVQPWLADEGGQYLSASVSGQPRMTRLVAYFPEQPQAFVLRVRESSRRDDLAVCTIETSTVPPSIAILPLDPSVGTVTVGAPVVMLSYISGVERLMASFSEPEARQINARYGASLETLLNHLAERGMIRPATTQGIITDLPGNQIVTSVTNNTGASGAPVFGSSGRVIGINYLMFTGDTASNFAMPVRFAVRLLERAGWQSDDAPAGNQNANAPGANSNTSNANGRGNANSNQRSGRGNGSR